MISRVLNSIATDINQFLRNRYNLNEDPVVISNLTGLDGSVAVDGENKIVLTIVNIEQENTIQKQNHASVDMQTSLKYMPPIYINLLVLMSAFFQNTNYYESLKMLSAALSFFQHKPIFNSQNTPGFDDNLEKITVEIVNLNINELSNLWGQLGGKYLPSILYKFRMIKFDGNYPVEMVNLVTSSQNKTAQK
ncbi:MAG: DUF4255 domain-containing protein [Chitinispirillaceae bacterium]|nr:DUF4255 domain-containing protein [Chitinispirillaceae bacterium]